jgi:tetratricopeptide (TPR) repeat protein
MKKFLSSAAQTFAIGLLAAFATGALNLSAIASPIQDKPKPAQASADEQKALLKVQNAPTLAAKIEAAKEYMKKHANGVERFKLVQHFAGEISKASDAATQISTAETLLTIFHDPKETALINSILIDSYVKAGKPDEAFKVGGAYLEKNPNDVSVLTQLAIFGVEQAKRGNGNFAQPSQTYGGKAIELIDADKMPENMDATAWGEYKTRWLPQLHQSLGILSYMMKKQDEAKVRFEKAVAINPNEPFNYAMLGSLANEEYQKYAEQYKSLMAGPLKDEALKRANAKLDEIIDLFAHAVGLAQGNPAYQALHDAIMQDLQLYYQSRKGSTTGLQELINKYKKQP